MANLYIERVTNSAKVPEKKTTHAACYDVRANLVNRIVKVFKGGINKGRVELIKKRIKLAPGDRAMIPTGWKMCCDPGWKIELVPRSGKSIKFGVTLINCTGVVDADFRQEAMLLVVNLSNELITITDEERIAQLSLEVVNDVNVVIGNLPDIDSNRIGGMGSTDND